MSRKSRRSSISAPLFRRGSGLFLAAAPGAPTASDLARRILSQSAYQRQMPGSTAEAPWTFSLSLGSLGEVVLVVLLGAGLLLLAQWLLEQRRGRWRRPGGSAAERPSAGASRSFAELAEVDRLAERGSYEEAVHALLLVAIRRLLEPLPAPPGPSRTSRELLVSLPLAPSRRQAFADLVREVELSLFGGRPLGLDGYARCRRSFDAVLAGGSP